MCSTLTDAMEVQPSLLWISIIVKSRVLLVDIYNVETNISHSAKTNKPRDKGFGEGKTKAAGYKDNKRNIIYTFNECACPELLFLITFPCDIICCKIVYA